VKKNQGKKNWWPKFKNAKKRGEWAELVFASRAIELGLDLAKPWGDSSGYDFTVDQGMRIVRVQVKCTIARKNTGYICALLSTGRPYKSNTFEFVAAYVIPEDTWYIIPERRVRGQWNVGLYPNLEKAKYRAYQEAWHLLRGEATRGIEIQACAEMVAVAPTCLE